MFTPGYRNRFGHPRPEIVARYVSAGVDNYRTDYEGALTSSSRAGATHVPLRERYRDPRYWREIPLHGRVYVARVITANRSRPESPSRR